MSWVERASDLLHGNEVIEEEVQVGTGGVVVTNQRVLVFTPDRAGANFRQVDRPNVESVESRATGERRFIMPGVKAGILGIVMVAFGYAFSFDQLSESISLDSGGAASAVGVGQLLGIIQTFIGLLAMLDDLLRIVGGLALAFSVVALGVYVWSRERLLVISVAGGDELTVGEDTDDDCRDRLQMAIRPDGPSSAATSEGDSGSGARLESEVDLGDGRATTDQSPDRTGETGGTASAQAEDDTLDLPDPDDL